MRGYRPNRTRLFCVSSCQATKRAKFRASSSSILGPAPKRVALPRDVIAPAGIVDLLESESENDGPIGVAGDSEGLRSFILDIWKHKKLSDKDLRTLCYYVTVAGVW